MPELDHKSIHWFHLCNCSTFSYKQSFYAFKARFLHRFGTPDGWDEQRINHECWTCGGTGLFEGHSTCRRCDGEGIYRTSFVWLARYELAGRIYHIPDERPPHVVKPVYKFTGYIRHEPLCSDSAAYRCYLRLLLRHEPITFWKHIVLCARSRVSIVRWRLTMKLVRLRNELDLFPAIKESDEVPF